MASLVSPALSAESAVSGPCSCRFTINSMVPSAGSLASRAAARLLACALKSGKRLPASVRARSPCGALALHRLPAPQARHVRQWLAAGVPDPLRRHAASCSNSFRTARVRTLTRGAMTNEGLAAYRAALPPQELSRVLMEIEARLQFQHRFSPFFMGAKKLLRSVTASLFLRCINRVRARRFLPGSGAPGAHVCRVILPMVIKVLCPPAEVPRHRSLWRDGFSCCDRHWIASMVSRHCRIKPATSRRRSMLSFVNMPCLYLPCMFPFGAPPRAP